MTEPHIKDEIPELCKAFFVSTKSGLVVVWTAALLLLGGVGTAIGWAFCTERALVELKVGQLSLQNAQTELQNQINKKLDILLKCSTAIPCVSTYNDKIKLKPQEER